MLTDWGGCLQVIGVFMILGGLAFPPVAIVGVLILVLGLIVGTLERQAVHRRQDRERISRLERELEQRRRPR